MGVAGSALALMGGQVTFTDLEEVLPLLRQNVAANLSPAAVRCMCKLSAPGNEGFEVIKSNRGSYS